MHVEEEGGDEKLIRDGGRDHGAGGQRAGDTQVLCQVKCLWGGGGREEQRERRGREGLGRVVFRCCGESVCVFMSHIPVYCSP